MKTLLEKVEKKLNSLNIGEFRSPDHKQQLIDAVAAQLRMNGDVVVMKSTNTRANIEDVIIDQAGPYLKARTVGAYIPRFPDDRGLSCDELRMEKDRNFKFLKAYVKNSGIQFENERKGEEKLNELAGRFYFGWNEKRELEARKIYKGMYAKPENLDDLLGKELNGIVDQDESSWRRLEHDARRRERARSLLGIYGDTPKEKQEALKEMISRIEKHEKRGDEFFKNLPVLKPDYPGYAEAIRARQLHNMGFDSTARMTVQERTRLESQVAGVMSQELGVTAYQPNTSTV